MYSENRYKDALLLARAVLSNQLARLAPAMYITLTRQTGRGRAPSTPAQTADYFLRCFHDYGVQLHLDEAGFARYLRGKRILEFGPGDILGVALLLYAHGAEHVECIDRFPMQKLSEYELQVYRALIDALDAEPRARAGHAFVGEGHPKTGFNPQAIQYRITDHGLSGARERYDLIVSRAVLEHVDRLKSTFFDMATALRPGGLAIHQVDLKSHGLDRYRPLDFLTWPEPLYRLMFSAKGCPNRWRADKYRELARQEGFHLKTLTPTECLDAGKIDDIRPALARTFRDVPREELGWLGFWMVLEKPPAASRPEA